MCNNTFQISWKWQLGLESNQQVALGLTIEGGGCLHGIPPKLLDLSKLGVGAYVALYGTCISHNILGDQLLQAVQLPSLGLDAYMYLCMCTCMYVYIQCWLLPL